MQRTADKFNLDGDVHHFEDDGGMEQLDLTAVKVKKTDSTKTISVNNVDSNSSSVYSSTHKLDPNAFKSDAGFEGEKQFDSG